MRASSQRSRRSCHSCCETPSAQDSWGHFLGEGPERLGFSISGGLFTEHVKNDHGIFVTKIIPGGAADIDGKLKVGDRLLSVNGISLEYVTHDEAVSAIASIIEQTNEIVLRVAKVSQYSTLSPGVVPLEHNLNLMSQDAVVDESEREPRRVYIHKGPSGLGFNIVGGEGGEGIFISFILTGGPADMSGELRKGDQILSVNDVDMTQATHEQAAEILKNSGSNVNIVAHYRPEAYERFQAKINERREQMLQTNATSTNLTSLADASHLIAKNKRTFYVRALFDYDPTKDSGLPGRGLVFHYGDILHVTNASDDEWWQAKRVSIDGVEEDLGIIPSKKRVERKEKARQRKVNFGRNSDSTMSKANTLEKKKKGIKFFSKSSKKENQSEEEPSDHEPSNEEVIYSYEPVVQHQCK